METITWGNLEYVPCTFEAFAIVGMPTIPMLEHPWFESGTDILGIPWVVDAMGATPDTRVEPILEDVCDCEKVVKFPDISGIDIKPIAAMELKDVDRDQKALSFYHPCGVFERLQALMGTTEGIVAPVEEPEACSELFEAITDYRIEVAKKIIDAYHPDVYITFDDVATANNTFMSPEAYREVIKPHHKRFVQFIKSQGIIPSQHCCGKCESLLDDFVDNGTMLWHSAQAMNDLEAIQEKYHGKLAIEGFLGHAGHSRSSSSDSGGRSRRDAPHRRDAWQEGRRHHASGTYQREGPQPCRRRRQAPPHRGRMGRVLQVLTVGHHRALSAFTLHDQD